MSFTKISIFTAGVAFVLLLIRLLRIGRRPAGYPPGPPTVPLLGNIHQMPTRDAHLQFQQWAQEYGPVYSLIMGTKTLIVLSSDVAVKDLMDKRSANYSDRQDMYIGQTLCSDGMRLLMMGSQFKLQKQRYGPEWRKFRKLVHGILNINAAKTYVPYQVLENKQMLFDILNTPDDVLSHIRRYSNSLTTSMTFGWRTPTKDDPQLQQLFEGFNEFAIINQTGTAALIDFFPFLRRLPDFVLPTQAKARQLHEIERKLYVGHWLRSKKSITDGTGNPCFCADLLRSQEKEGFSDAQAGYISGTLLEAGSDTTSNTLYGFVQAMVLFPEVQRKAQAEIDRVVGKERMPTMGDEDDLQYIRGCMKESLRWMPTTILGAVPHAAVADDTYLGYVIPKGAGVMNNAYAIHMDPGRFPNPREFNPDRYKDDFQSLHEAATNPDASKRDNFTFGAGRRICPGIHVAERSLFLGISRLLWTFDFKPKVVGGKEVPPDPERLTQGFVCMPEPFECQIVPRSREREQMVRREWEEASRLLDKQTLQWKEVPEGMVLPPLQL